MSKRRDNVPFDPRYFEKENARRSLRETFTHIYETDLWSGPHSVSGAGSGRDQTQIIAGELTRLVEEFGVDVFLDVPCGDFGWMRHVALPVKKYIGGDVVEELVERNRIQYQDSTHTFQVLDLTTDPLPAADMLFCRDALVHLSFDDALAVLENIRSSDIELLLTTTFTDCGENEDIPTGDWRILNLQLPPFNFPAPLCLINERCMEGGGTYRDKSHRTVASGRAAGGRALI